MQLILMLWMARNLFDAIGFSADVIEHTIRVFDLREWNPQIADGNFARDDLVLLADAGQQPLAILFDFFSSHRYRASRETIHCRYIDRVVAGRLQIGLGDGISAALAELQLDGSPRILR